MAVHGQICPIVHSGPYSWPRVRKDGQDRQEEISAGTRYGRKIWQLDLVGQEGETGRKNWQEELI